MYTYRPIYRGGEIGGERTEKERGERQRKKVRERERESKIEREGGRERELYRLEVGDASM